MLFSRIIPTLLFGLTLTGAPPVADTPPMGSQARTDCERACRQCRTDCRERDDCQPGECQVSFETCCAAAGGLPAPDCQCAPTDP